MQLKENFFKQAQPQRMKTNHQQKFFFFQPQISAVSHVQRKNSAAVAPLENYINDLNGRGNGLDDATKKFFEAQFDYDFSNVKIHNDADATRSAQSVNALAYTVGNNIVFDKNKFQPHTLEGKKLLAHELTHVMQQNRYVAKQIQRKATFEKQKPEENINLAERFVQAIEKGERSSHFGKTYPTINGIDLTQSGIDNPIKIPVETDIQSTKAEKNNECSFTKVPDNVTSFKMWIPSKSEKWKYESDINRLKNLLEKKHCSNAIVTIILTGDPDSTTVYANTKKHEEVHASHVEKLHKDVIESFDKDISSRKVQGKDESTCKRNLLKYTEVKAKSAWTDFANGFNKMAQDFHNTEVGHNGIMSITDIDSDCAWIKVKGKE